MEPYPLQSSTRTDTSLTPFATPTVAPPTVPAQWVPCPLQSSQESYMVKPSAWTRSPNSACVLRIPVSSTNTVTDDAVVV